MKLYEYQTKQLFARCGISIPRGKTATTPQEVYEIANEFGGPVMIQPQVLAEDQGGVVGIRIAENPEIALELADESFNIELQDGKVKMILVEVAPSVVQEIYVGIWNDCEARKPVLVASEEINSKNERSNNHVTKNPVTSELINPFIGLRHYQAHELASNINLPHEHWKAFAKLVTDLYNCYITHDAILVEISPLVITDKNELVALHGRMIIDDNALYRQPELAEMRKGAIQEALQTGINLVKLRGEIGCIVNGSGLAMATIDMLQLYSGNQIGAAHICDIGIDPFNHKITAALRLSSDDPTVKVILLNLFSGIISCNEIAHLILQSLLEIQPQTPVIVRLEGVNAEEGMAQLIAAHYPELEVATTLTDAAKRAIRAARELHDGYSRR